MLERVVRGNDDIGTVSHDIDVPGAAKGDYPIGDSILLGVGVEVVRPIRAGPRTVPLMGRKFVDDGRLICACCQGRLDVALVEAVHELMQGLHHIGLLGCDSG